MQSLIESSSLSEIERLSIPSNFKYGQAIYKRGGVEFIELESTKAEAWVGGLDGTVAEGAGSRRRTQLLVTPKGLAWHCAGNPKNHQIFCKHCVALALALQNKKDPRIDNYIAGLPNWQQVVAQKVRSLVHAADPGITETIKFTNRPYFVLEGNVCALLGAKDHLNIFIYDPIAPDPDGIINQGQNNKSARSIQLKQADALNERAFVNLIKTVVANNRAGGWRKLQKK